MKECPFKLENCEDCRFNVGPSVCGVFSAAADASRMDDLFKELAEIKSLLKILIGGVQ
jgi:hypothetical protein